VEIKEEANIKTTIIDSIPEVVVIEGEKNDNMGVIIAAIALSVLGLTFGFFVVRKVALKAHMEKVDAA
jgi:predicted tellurium resistance membrane protein TerC